MQITLITNTLINKIQLIVKNLQIITQITQAEAIIKNKMIITEDSFNLQSNLRLNNPLSSRSLLILITIIINTNKIIFLTIIIITLTIHFPINLIYILNNKIKCNTLYNNKQCLSSNRNNIKILIAIIIKIIKYNCKIKIVLL